MRTDRKGFGNPSGLATTNGDGTFGAPLLIAHGSYTAWSALAGDVNGDGKPDVVTGHRTTNFHDYFSFTTLINDSGPCADLSLNMSASCVAVQQNFPVYFISVISNTGTATATNVTLRNPLLSWVSFDAVTTTQGSCANASGVVSCNVGTMAPNTVQTVTLTVRPVMTGTVWNTASVNNSTTDPDLGDNSASAFIGVLNPTPAWFSGMGVTASSGRAGTNARAETIIYMQRTNRTDIAVSGTINRNLLPCAPANSVVLGSSILFSGSTYNLSQTPGPNNTVSVVGVIPANNVANGTIKVRVNYHDPVCNQDFDLIIPVVEVILYDPSGIVRNAVTNLPIADATVTLYRVPGAQPDSGGITRDCRTVDTRPGGITGNWSSLPQANLASGVMPDLLFDPADISPAINPPLTNDNGRYGWDVVQGCWFVKVVKAGFVTKISALVGIPPAVTDLDITLQPNAIYLPLIVR